MPSSLCSLASGSGGLRYRSVTVLTLLLDGLWSVSLAAVPGEVQVEMEPEAGWRWTPGDIQLHDTLQWGEKNAEKQNIQRCFTSAALGVTPLPEMSKGHREALLQTTWHGDGIARKETLCRGDNSCRTSAGTHWRSD